MSKEDAEKEDKLLARAQRSSGLAKIQAVKTAADHLSGTTHFSSEECKCLITLFERIKEYGRVDRLRFRELLHTAFDITDDVMLDLTFRAFNQSNNAFISSTEWVKGLSAVLRGTLDEMIEFVYFIYDMNGDRSLAREELTHCLKGCIHPNYGIDGDEIDECERDIIEIAMKKLDVDHDGQITFPDFFNAVHSDPLLLQACGPCLPSEQKIIAFLSLITERYRSYTPSWKRSWLGTVKTKASKASLSDAPKPRLSAKGEA